MFISLGRLKRKLNRFHTNYLSNFAHSSLSKCCSGKAVEIKKKRGVLNVVSLFINGSNKKLAISLTIKGLVGSDQFGNIVHWVRINLIFKKFQN